ncbi:hypothetical protein TNCV_3416221 [Trichonephila clavipes]|nr:hypothetical protein TNCV_3416221 [Trichonephila clavipes]
MGNAKRRVRKCKERNATPLVNGSTIKHPKNMQRNDLLTPVSFKIKHHPLALMEEIAEYQRKPLYCNRTIDMEVLLNLFLQL